MIYAKRKGNVLPNQVIKLDKRFPCYINVKCFFVFTINKVLYCLHFILAEIAS